MLLGSLLDLQNREKDISHHYCEVLVASGDQKDFSRGAAK